MTDTLYQVELNAAGYFQDRPWTTERIASSPQEAADLACRAVHRHAWASQQSRPGEYALMLGSRCIGSVRVRVLP